MTEIWKPIESYENYEVSNQGKVRNVKTGLILKPNGVNEGYLHLCLHSGGLRRRFRVHHLVAQAFVENVPTPELRDAVLHLDKVLTNNHAENLKWVPKWILNLWMLPEIRRNGLPQGVYRV